MNNEAINMSKLGGRESSLNLHKEGQILVQRMILEIG